MLRVAILAGGNSAEAQVSRNSAAQIEQALVDSGHKTQVIELDDHCVQALLTMQPDVVFLLCTARPAKTVRYRVCSKCFAYPMLAATSEAARWQWIRPSPKCVFIRRGLPVSEDYIVHPSDDLSDAAETIQAQLGARARSSL